MKEHFNPKHGVIDKTIRKIRKFKRKKTSRNNDKVHLRKTEEL